MNYLILITLLIMPACHAMHEEMEYYLQRIEAQKLEKLEAQVMMLTSENKTLRGQIKVAELLKKHNNRPAETQTDFAQECYEDVLLNRIKELQTANVVLYSRNKMLESNLKYFLIGKKSNQDEETQT